MIVLFIFDLFSYKEIYTKIYTLYKESFINKRIVFYPTAIPPQLALVTV